MDKTALKERINARLADEFEKDAATFAPDANMQKTLGMDSLDLVDLVVMIEEETGVKLKKEDFATITTFDEFYDLIISRANN